MEPHHVHRLMFYNLEPTSINTIAYSKRFNLLAVLRNDNRVEIWDMKSTPVVLSTIFLDKETRLQGLVWSKKRLFGADLNGSVKELDLITLRERSVQVIVSGGTFNCMTIDPTEKLLAIGTEMGFINVFQVKKRGVSFVKLIQSEPKRVLCIGWDTSSSHLVIGGIEFIRLYRYDDGRLLRNMKPSALKMRKKENVYIWSVAIADDLTIFAGDSSGSLSIWDGNRGVCTVSFKSHIADVLTICLSNDRRRVYCAGIDPYIRTYEKLSSGKWVKAKDIITHTHDVKGLVELNDGKLCSGGVDSYLTISKMSPHVVKIFPPLLQCPSVHISTQSRYVMLRYSKHLELWHITSLNENKSDASQPFTKLVELHSKDDELIRCASMSESGEWIAYATNTTFRIFNFTFIDNCTPNLKLIPVDDLAIENIRHLCFSRNNKFLCIGNSLTFQMVRLQVSSSNSLESVKLPQESVSEENREDNFRVINMAVSEDGNYVALATDGGQVSVWTKKCFHCALPKSPFPATAMIFQPENELLVAYSDYSFIEFSIKSRHYTEFSKSFNSDLVEKYLGRFNLPITNISTDHDDKSKIVLHTTSDICVFDKNKVVSTVHKKKKMKFDPDMEKSIQRVKHNAKNFQLSVNLNSYFKNGFEEKSSKDLAVDEGFHVFEKYQHLVHFSSIGSREMVAVEVKPRMFLEKLPPALMKGRYGRK